MNIWQHAVITYKGLALQAKLIEGNTLAITKIEVGAGQVAEDALREQVAVSEPQMTLHEVASIVYPEEGQCTVDVKITNSDVTTAWTARQIGFYATDPDEGEILYFLAQSDQGTGTLVPADTEMYDYAAEWAFTFKYGQADNVTVVVDPANTVSWDEMEAYVAAQLKDFKPGDFIPIAEKGAAQGVATLDDTAKLTQQQIPNIDCGIWDSRPIDIQVLEHNSTPTTHTNMIVDGNNLEVMDNAVTLEEHIVAPYAHQNMILDGNDA